MTYTKKLEFGNFTLKFGPNKVLLDFFEEIVEPSFESQKHQRRIENKGEYFFLNTSKVKISDIKGDSHAAIVGRIVKNTKIKREQIFQDNHIVLDKKELETAPTSIFVLLLENHRLLFCRELPGAPSIQNFEATCQKFLTIEHKLLVEKIIKEATPENEKEPPRGTKKKINERYPSPKLRVTPLSDRQSLRDFLNRFKKIDKVTIKLLPTNQEEIDNDSFWADLGRRKEEMGSTTASIQFNGGKDGLVGNKVEDQISAASGMGNSQVQIRGQDSEGDSIKGNNEDFSLSIDLASLPENITEAAKQMLGSFLSLATLGLIKIPLPESSTIQKIQSFFIKK